MAENSDRSVVDASGGPPAATSLPGDPNSTRSSVPSKLSQNQSQPAEDIDVSSDSEQSPRVDKSEQEEESATGMFKWIPYRGM